MKSFTEPHGHEIDLALLEVRKAYRLLHDYQRMVLDAVDYIGKQFGLTYGGGWAKFSNVTPRNGKGGLRDYWAWDWLNMVFYEFHFSKELQGGGNLIFAVLLISDTGYFCAEDEKLEKTDVSAYLAPAKSSTRVGFIISQKGWDMGFAENKMEMKRFIETDGELPAEYKAKGIIGKCVDLARLASEKETNDLLDELADLARKADIPLERVGVRLKVPR